MYPLDDADYARALFLEEYADSELMPVFGAGVFRPRIVYPLARKEQPDEATVADAVANKLPPLFDYVEGEIEGKEFLVGGSLTIADISVASMFCNMRHAEVLPDPNRWPNLARYIDRMHERPREMDRLSSLRSIFSSSVLSQLSSDHWSPGRTTGRLSILGGTGRGKEPARRRVFTVTSSPPSWSG